MDFDFTKLSDREILILMAQAQKQLAEEIKDLKQVILTKADAKRMEEIENDVKMLKKTIWIASGAAGVLVWAVEHILLK